MDKRIIAIIFFSIILVIELVILYLFFGTNILKKNENQLNEEKQIIESNSHEQDEANKFNNEFEKFIGDNKNVQKVYSLFENLKVSNKKSGNVISIIFNNELIDDPSTITLDEDMVYNISAIKNEKGYINQISILQAGQGENIKIEHENNKLPTKEEIVKNTIFLGNGNYSYNYSINEEWKKFDSDENITYYKNLLQVDFRNSLSDNEIENLAVSINGIVVTNYSGENIIIMVDAPELSDIRKYCNILNDKEEVLYATYVLTEVSPEVENDWNSKLIIEYWKILNSDIRRIFNYAKNHK